MPSPRLDLPYLSVAQAQKEVTHNDALNRLDLVVQASVLDRDLTVPPPSPVQGAAYLVAAGAGGAWAGHDGELAAWYGTAWVFRPPWPGFVLYVADEARVLRHDGTAWALDAAFTGAAPASHGHVIEEVTGLQAALDGKQPLQANLTTLAGLGAGARTALGLGAGDGAAFDRLGLGGAAADAINRLSLNSPALLFNHAGAGIQAKLNKNAAADTASCLFQTGFSGRAEFGLAGSDDVTLKVSPDGASWLSALTVDRTTGAITLGSPLGVGQGGTGAANAAAARGNLGLAIGSNVQAYSATLGLLAGLSPAADKGLYFTGGGSAATFDLSGAARSLLDDATTAAMLTTLGALPLAGGAMTGTITNGQATQCLNFTNVSGTVLFRGVTTFGTGISANRFYQIDASGQPTARYDDNGVVTGLTLQNYGLTGANQGANLFVCQLGTGGAALGDRGEISLMATDTYADGAHATNRFVFRPVSAGVKAARFLIEGNGDLKSSFGIFVDGNGHLRLRAYTVATLPSAATAAQMIYVSDGTANKRLAISDGTNWRFPDGAVVS